MQFVFPREKHNKRAKGEQKICMDYRHILLALCYQMNVEMEYKVPL